MKKYRVYEAHENGAGGVEGCGTGFEYIYADSAEKAARERWDCGWPDSDEKTVIVATDDNGDSYHFYPLRPIQMKVCRREACYAIVAAIEQRYTTPTMDRVIGITFEGGVDFFYQGISDGSKIAIIVIDTQGGWTLGDFEGDTDKPEDWEKNFEAIVQGFEEIWLDEILRESEISVVWEEETPE